MGRYRRGSPPPEENRSYWVTKSVKNTSITSPW